MYAADCLSYALYSWTLAFLMLAVNIRIRQITGNVCGNILQSVRISSGTGDLAGILGLEKQQRYKVNILAGWISPLNHATYPGHTFGYDDLPSVFQSGALFLAFLVLLFLLAGRALKSYNFTFMGY